MEWQLYRLAAVSSPCSQYRHLAAGCLTALQSVSSPYSQYRHLAVSLLALLLVALKSASQPCSQPHRLAVSPIALQSTSSPCCWLPHSLAISPIALQSTSSPCCWPHRLTVVNIVPYNAPYFPTYSTLALCKRGRSPSQTTFAPFLNVPLENLPKAIERTTEAIKYCFPETIMY